MSDLKDDYLRKAEIIRVVDGDTIECMIDLGLRTYRKTKLRVFGVNCPETKGPTKADGLISKTFTKEWFNTNKEFMVRTVNNGKEDSFGRLIAEVISVGGESLGTTMISLGLAVAFMDGSDTTGK
jgi:micrococcal nuclease